LIERHSDSPLFVTPYIKYQAGISYYSLGCEEVRKSNPKYFKFVNCATEKGHQNCVECGSHHTCNDLKDSHPGECNLGLTANEVTKMIVPYNAQNHLIARSHIFLDNYDNTANSNTQTLRISTSGDVDEKRAGLATTE